MNRIRILDCTLRDGGYINEWNFGGKVIRGIIEKLEEAQIDIIECGFLRDKTYDPDVSVYSAVEQISEIITPKQSDVLYVAMIALGDIPIDSISPCNGKSIDGIRLTFHKHEWENARKATVELMRKGYKVFVQPVGTTSYTDSELLSLIQNVNELNPYAFYLVDTLGILYQNEMRRIFYLIDHNLRSEISIGFHSHNNLQLSFSNAQEFMRLNPKRRVIIDASVYGMGRGVGNLATELIAEYTNANLVQRYSIIPLLSIADKYIMPIYAKTRWGYDLPYFISATVQCHPNYASYLLKKSTLRVEDINHILQSIPADRRELFDVDLAEKLYYEYQKCCIDDSNTINTLKEKIAQKEVLILAPGGSIAEKEDEIRAYIEHFRPVVISVNYVPASLSVDMAFVSNNKRIDLTIEQMDPPCELLLTSNVQLNRELPCAIHYIKYSDYIGEGRAADNAGAILIRFIRKCQAKKIILAGFDGFAETVQSNFSVDSYRSPITAEEAKQKNKDIAYQLSRALQTIDYTFITPTRYRIG